jgi:hypothetical protein
MRRQAKKIKVHENGKQDGSREKISKKHSRLVCVLVSCGRMVKSISFAMGNSRRFDFSSFLGLTSCEVQ